MRQEHTVRRPFDGVNLTGGHHRGHNGARSWLDLRSGPAARACSVLLTQGSRYVVVGTGNVFIDVGLLNVAVIITHVTSGPLLVSFASLSFLAAVTNSYYWNGRWTFQAPLRWKFQFPLFVGVTLVGLLINGATIALLTAHPIGPMGLSPVLRVNEAKLVAIGITAMWNFLSYRHIVFHAA